MSVFRILTLCLLVSGLTAGEGAFAANIARGKSLYLATPNKFAISFNCADAGCHTADPSANVKLNGKGSSAAAIKAAINGGVPTMAIYGPVNGAGNLTDTDIADIAAYIGNPAAGAILTVSTTTLTFAPVAFGASSPSRTVTVTNTGLASLTVTAATTSGANAGDFNITNNCTAAVASNGTCTIAVAMSTAVSGTKSATLTIASNAGSQAVTISGTVSGAASVGLNAPSGGLTFPDTTVGLTSAANNLPPSGIVTLTNTGSAALNMSALTPSAGFTLDQAAASSCKVATPVAASQTCTLSIKFAPGTAGAKTGSLTITHNGATSPSTIGLSGNGVVASTPTPAAALDKTVLTFGDQIVGASSVTQQVSLTNGGTKALTITDIQDSSGEFVRTGTCATGQLPIGASCTIVVAFSPASAAPTNATITLTDDAGNVAGTTQTISLSGIGKATALPTPTLTATTLDFGNQSLNTASSVKVVTISNTSTTDPLVISSISLTGVSATEYAIDSSVANACSTVAPVSVSGSCDVALKFTPTTSGTRDATLTVNTNATGSPHQVALTGTGSGTTGATSTPSVSTNIGGGGCAMQSQRNLDPTLPSLLLLSLTSLLTQWRRNLRPLRSRCR